MRFPISAQPILVVPGLMRYDSAVVPNVDLPAISSPNFKPGPPVDEAQVFSQQIHDLLISSVPIFPRYTYQPILQLTSCDCSEQTSYPSAN